MSHGRFHQLLALILVAAAALTGAVAGGLALSSSPDTTRTTPATTTPAPAESDGDGVPVASINVETPLGDVSEDVRVPDAEPPVETDLPEEAALPEDAAVASEHDTRKVPLAEDLPLAAKIKLALLSSNSGDSRVETAGTETRAPASPGLSAAGGIGLAALALLGAGAVSWFWPTIRGYTRIADDEVFENEVRQRVFDLVRENPGMSARELSRAADVSWGTIVYHLDVLQRTKMVVSIRDGRYRRFFPVGGAKAEERKRISALQNDLTARVAERVRVSPGLAQKDLAAQVGMTPQALHWHVQRLLQVGLIQKERDGRAVRFYPPVADPVVPSA